MNINNLRLIQKLLIQALLLAGMLEILASALPQLPDLSHQLIAYLLSNSTITTECRVKGLTCDLKAEHCPYSAFSEPYCTSCRDTCDPALMGIEDNAKHCIRNCSSYLLRICAAQVQNRPTDAPPQVKGVPIQKEGCFVPMLLFLIWAVGVTVGLLWKTRSTWIPKLQNIFKKEQHQHQGRCPVPAVSELQNETAQFVPANDDEV